jgi:hypothetical protein
VRVTLQNFQNCESKMMEDIAQKLSSSDIILAQLQSSPQKEKLLIIQEILQRNESLLFGIFKLKHLWFKRH